MGKPVPERLNQSGFKMQEMRGFWDAVASAGSYANSLHLASDIHTNTSSLDFYRPHAFPDAQPTLSKH